MTHRPTHLTTCLVVLILAIATVSYAAPSSVSVRVNGNALSVEPEPGFSHGVLTVRMRGAGVVYKQGFSPDQGLFYALQTDQGETLADGRYVFEVWMVGASAETTRMTGTFEVVAGSITPQTHEDDGGGALIEIVDVLMLGDAIVEGRICASDAQECDIDSSGIILDAENFDTPGFGHAEVKLKDDIPEIWFADTTAGDGDFAITVEESRFFVRDPDADTLPLTIESGAPSSSVYVTQSGRVGIGTASPTQELHVEDGSDANSNGAIRISTASHTWDLSTNENTGQFRISRLGTGTVEFNMSQTGDLNIQGTLTTGGTVCGDGCDLVFSEGYDLDSIEEHASAMWSKGYLPAVGATKENQPINLTEKVGGMLNELEKAHIYIAQLNQLFRAELDDKDAQIAVLTERLAAVEARVEEQSP